jgi:hypothetical protein
MYIVCQVKNVRYIVVEAYFIGRTIGVNCEQMMEFTLKIKKANPLCWICLF